MIKMLRSKKGSALLLMVIITVTAIALSLAILSGVATNSILEARQEALRKARYIALAGVDYARYIVKNGLIHTNPWPRGAGFNDFGDNVTVAIDDSVNPYIVTSTGVFSGASKKLSANVSPTGAIMSWN